MISPSELRPHVLVRTKSQTVASPTIYDCYRAAWVAWCRDYDWRDDDPLAIATISRLIQPETPIVDVNE